MNGYPTLAQVEEAGQAELIRWTRYLPSPSDADRPTLERILERLRTVREEDPDGHVAASKAVGWDGP